MNLICVLFLFLCAVNCQPPEDGAHDADFFYRDKSDWVDPGNIFTYDPLTKSNIDKTHKSTQTETHIPESQPLSCPHSDCHKVDAKLDTCRKELASYKAIASRSGDHRAESFLRHLTSKTALKLEQLVKTVDGKSKSTLHIQFPLKSADLKRLQRYVLEEADGKNTLDTLSETLAKFLDTFDVIERERWYVQIMAYFPGILLAIALFYIIYILRRRFVLLFLFVCTLWEWFKLYKNVLARREEVIAKVPAHCFQGHSSSYNWLSAINVWLGNQLSFVQVADSCTEYYQAIYVDPILEANPAKAFSEVLGMIFLYPITLIGNYTGLSIQKFFSHIPGFHMIWIGPLSFLVVIAFLLAISRMTFNSLVSSSSSALFGPRKVPIESNKPQTRSRRAHFLNSSDSPHHRRALSVGDVRRIAH
ncbi:Chloride channel CLIC-like protein 1 [Halotydeus destructor]|nr:Chloride channel CLIC-like protein 1 [Halotydeus destructor]